MRKGRKVLPVILTLVICLGFAGCGKDFDAAAYTKSVLEANYHEAYKTYAEFRNISESEAQKEIEDNRISLAEQELTVIGEATDEEIATYVESVKGMEKLASYEVKSAEKQDDDSYIVTVEITPSLVYQKLEDVSAEITMEMIADGKNPMESNSTFYQLLNESVKRAIEANEYGEVTTIEVKVAPDDDGSYGISEEDMQALEEALFPKA